MEIIIPFLLIFAGLVVSVVVFLVINPTTFMGEIFLICTYIILFFVLFLYLKKQFSKYKFGVMYKNVFLFMYVITAFMMLFKVHFTVMHL